MGSTSTAIMVGDLIFEEVEGPRRIEMSGRALPFRGPEFGGTTIAPRQQHQGNPLSTIQVLGTMEKQTIYEGRWKSEFLTGSYGRLRVKSGPYTDLKSDDETLESDLIEPSGLLIVPGLVLIEFCKAITEIRVSAPLLEVTWLGFARRGIILDFSWSPQDHNDIAWSLTMEWESHDAGFRPPVYKEIQLPERILDDWADKIGGIVDFLEGAFGFDPVKAGLGQYRVPVLSDVFGMIDKINTQVARFKTAQGSLLQASSILSRAVMAPSATLRNVLQSVLDLKQTLKDASELWITNSFAEYEAWEGIIGDTEVAFSNDQASLLGGVSTTDGGSSLDGLRSYADTFAMRGEFRALEYLIDREARNIRARFEPEIVDMVIASENQHLGTIARQFFGDFSAWQKLGEFNHIHSPVLEAGALILIPRELPPQ